MERIHGKDKIKLNIEERQDRDRKGRNKLKM